MLFQSILFSTCIHHAFWPWQSRSTTCHTASQESTCIVRKEKQTTRNIAGMRSKASSRSSRTEHIVRTTVTANNRQVKANEAQQTRQVLMESLPFSSKSTTEECLWICCNPSPRLDNTSWKILDLCLMCWLANEFWNGWLIEEDGIWKVQWTDMWRFPNTRRMMCSLWWNTNWAQLVSIAQRSRSGNVLFSKKRRRLNVIVASGIASVEENNRSRDGISLAKNCTYYSCIGLQRWKHLILDVCHLCNP